MYMKFVRIGPYDGPLFDRYVQKTPAFVKFYSPNCFHCTNMAPAWDALEKHTERGVQRNVIIVEVHEQAIPSIRSECARKIMGFPTIMVVKPGGYPGKEYHGSRDTKSLLDFLHNTFPPVRGHYAKKGSKRKNLKKGTSKKRASKSTTIKISKRSRNK